MLEVRQLRAYAPKLRKKRPHCESVEDALEFSTAIEHDRLLTLRCGPNFVVSDDRRAARAIFVKSINPSPEGNAGLPDWDGRERGPRVRPVARLAEG